MNHTENIIVDYKKIPKHGYVNNKQGNAVEYVML